MKKVLKTIGILCLVIVVLIAGLFIKGMIDANKPFLSDNYLERYVSDSPLEMKYSQKGRYEVSQIEFKSDNSSISRIRVWYPSELGNIDKLYPMILVVNASNTRAKNYMPFFERLASWGFIVVGNDDPQAGTGKTASVTLDYMLNIDMDSVLYNKIDTENIGIVGYSQGGAGALASVTMYDNGNMYKVIFTGSAAYPLLAKNMGWTYDPVKISIPYFMTAGTGTSDDRGVEDTSAEFGGVAPLSSLVEIYETMSDEVFKIRGRVAGAEHVEMQIRTDGYMTAWMLYHLQGDEEAGTVFLGESAEILHNLNWQDVEENR